MFAFDFINNCNLAGCLQKRTLRELKINNKTMVSALGSLNPRPSMQNAHL